MRIRHGPHHIATQSSHSVDRAGWQDKMASIGWGLCEYVIVHTILGGSPVILWISLGGKPKWLPLKFGYHDVMRTSPIYENECLQTRKNWNCPMKIVSIAVCCVFDSSTWLLMLSLSKHRRKGHKEGTTPF